MTGGVSCSMEAITGGSACTRWELPLELAINGRVCNLKEQEEVEKNQTQPQLMGVGIWDA